MCVNSQTKFIHLDYGYWSVFTNYEDNDYLLIHDRSQNIQLPEDNWKYFDKDSSYEDEFLEVKSKMLHLKIPI